MTHFHPSRVGSQLCFWRRVWQEMLAKKVHEKRAKLMLFMTKMSLKWMNCRFAASCFSNYKNCHHTWLFAHAQDWQRSWNINFLTFWKEFFELWLFFWAWSTDTCFKSRLNNFEVKNLSQEEFGCRRTRLMNTAALVKKSSIICTTFLYKWVCKNSWVSKRIPAKKAKAFIHQISV